MRLAVWTLTATIGAALALGACTTVENDPSTNSPIFAYRTRIDFQPPSRTELTQQLALEKQVLAEREKDLTARIEQSRRERQKLYAEIEKDFPECQRQRHCLSSLSTGDVARFERYGEASKRLATQDGQTVELETELASWQRRYDLRGRALYNRYLARELLQLPSYAPEIRQILVHSLEAFPNRRTLSYRLVRLADPDLLPAIVGDLDFRMQGRPIDEAAVLATFDVYLQPRAEDEGKPGRRYFVTFLVNTHQLDPQFYEQGFLRSWAPILSQPGLGELKSQTFCALYSIAGSTLAARLAPGKTKPCGPQRERLQALDASRFTDRMNPENWILPVALQEVQP